MVIAAFFDLPFFACSLILVAASVRERVFGPTVALTCATID
jgi:hypothetical protein